MNHSLPVPARSPANTPLLASPRAPRSRKSAGREGTILRAFLTTFSFWIALVGATELGAQEVSAVEGKLILRRVDPVLGQSTAVGTIPLASSAEHVIGALARSNNGMLYGISTAQTTPSVVTADPSRLYVIDETNANSVVVQTLPPIIPIAATVHPIDGSLWVVHAAGPLTPFGAHLFVMRIDPALGQSAHIGELPLFHAPFSGLAFDATGTTLYTVKITDSTLWQVDPTNPGGGSTGPVGGLGFLVGFGADLARRDNGSILGYDRGSGAFFTVDTTTGAATTIGNLASPMLGPVAAGGCGGEAVPYGAGCAGSGGFVPQLLLAGCADPGAGVTLLLQNGLGGSTALVFLAAGPATIPVGAGCSLLVAPPFAAPVALPLAGVGFGNGTLTIPATVPASLSGVSVYLQSFVIDPAVSIGAAASNGLRVTIP